MNDPLFAILSAVGQLAWSAAVRAARTPTGQQVVARAAGLAAAGATQATVNKLRDKDIDVSPGVEGFATAAAAVAGSMAGARVVDIPQPVPSADTTPVPDGPLPVPSTGQIPRPLMPNSLSHSMAADPPPPTIGYSGPLTQRYVGAMPERTNPYQGPNPMIPDVQIEKPPPIRYGNPPAYPPPPIQYGNPPPPPPPPPPPIQYGNP